MLFGPKVLGFCVFKWARNERPEVARISMGLSKSVVSPNTNANGVLLKWGKLVLVIFTELPSKRSYIY